MGNIINLFLPHFQDWDQVREIHAYPPATGKLALYTKQEFYKFTDFAVSTWSTIEDDALEPLFRNSSFSFCVERLRDINITKLLHIVTVDHKIDVTCLTLSHEDTKSFNDTRQGYKSFHYTYL